MRKINVKAAATATKGGVVSASKKLYHGSTAGAVSGVVHGAKVVGSKVHVSKVARIKDIRISLKDKAEKAARENRVAASK